MTLPAPTFFSAYTRPLLILIILLAFGLRVYKSGAYGVFFDEKHTLVVSQGFATELQPGFIGLLLLRIYQDRDPKYAYFPRPGIENPYYTSAQAIKHSPNSIEDAQLTNLYLPREARYPQRPGTTQSDRIVLVEENR